MRILPATCVGAVLGGSLLAGCGGGSPVSGGGTSVVAAFYPFAYVAERVAGDHASVTNLTAAGAEPHDLELAPQQVAELAEADVVIYEKGFQPAVDDAVEENAEGTVVEVTDLAPADVAGAAAPEDEHEAHAHGHDHTDLAGDPHLWQDPTKLAAVTRGVAGALTRADRDHAAGYRRNAAGLVRDLRALDREFERGLADCARRTVVTSHAAFGHLADRYDLQMVPIAGISPDTEPSPARLADLQHVATERGVTTVFTETLASPALARTLADEIGVRTAVLDPIEGLSDATADEDYFSLMRSNLAALRRANGCS